MQESGPRINPAAPDSRRASASTDDEVVDLTGSSQASVARAVCEGTETCHRPNK